MKKIILSLLCVIALALPFVFLAVCSMKIPPQYDESFLGKLTDKYELLKSTESPKIVLIGGSNLPFGVDSELLEEYVGLPVVNFGLYAALGTKPMLDLAEDYLSDGDIAIICPETDPQTYSLYFGADSMLMALDGNPEMFSDIKSENYGEMLAALPSFVSSKYNFYKNGTKPKPTDIYSPKSFNKYGDISVSRNYNEMPANHDTTTPVLLSRDITSDEFISYLNKFTKKAERRGAKVYFSFSPMNQAAIKSTDDEKEEFYRYLGENLSFPVISDIDDYIFPSAYFYDTNFHLNSRGALTRTALLADDIRRELGLTEFVETIKYSAPKRPDNYFAADGKNSDNTNFFEYEKTDGGLVLTALTDEGKKQKSLTLASSKDGQPIISIGEKAFSGGSLKTLIIGEDSALSNLGARAFADCSSLTAIEISKNPDKLTVSEDTFEGMNPGCYIYVSEELYGNFATDYFWSGHMEHVKMKS